MHYLQNQEKWYYFKVVTNQDDGEHDNEDPKIREKELKDQIEHHKQLAV